jgi:leader peptidase (prepilin peptidase)/N-methyltransferase
MVGAFAFLVLGGCALGAVLHRPALRAVARYTDDPPSRGRVALLAVLVLGGTVAACGPHRHLPALLWAAAFAVPLALVDLAEHRLPDRLTYPSAAGTLLLLAAAAAAGDRTGSALGALSGALALAALFWLMGLALPVGLGDAKLALTVGAVLGWYGFRTLAEGVFLGFLLAGVYGTAKLVARRAGRRDELPFGPFLLLGTLAAVALSAAG